MAMTNRAEGRPELALITAVALLVAPVTGNCTDATECSSRQVWIRANGAPVSLVLAWRGPGARASLALLLPVLAASGLCGVRLCEAPQGLCALLTHRPKPPYLLNAFVAGIEMDSRMQCPRSERLLSSSGAPRAPLAPRLHAVLSESAAATQRCLGAADLRFYGDATLLSACEFKTPLDVLVPREWSALEEAAGVAALLRDLRGVRRDCDRSELEREVGAAEASFLFVDAELWGDERRVLPIASASADADPPLLGVERAHLLMYAPPVLDALRAHRPPPRLLRGLLAREARQPERLAPGPAAARAATMWAEEDPTAFAAPNSTRAERYRVVVYECEEDGPAADLEEALRDLSEHVSAAHLFALQLEVGRVRCEDAEELAQSVQELTRSAGAYRLLGAVAAGAGFEAGAAAARNAGVELVAYDAQRARAGALAAGLVATLSACGWRRAALLSERSGVAREVQRRVVEALDAVRAEALPESPEAVRAALSALHGAGARVFVLNAGAAGVARALAAGAALRLEGAAWVAREWAGPAPPPARLLALSAAPRRAASGSPAGRALARRWKDGPWPSRAGPAADAVLTLALGFARLMRERPEIRFDHRTDGTLQLLHRSLAEGEPLPGVAGNLTFDGATGAPAPPALRLELWRPGLVWPDVFHDVAGAAAACPAPRVLDGASRCALPTGDPFAPVCLDALAAVGSPALLLAALLVGYGAAAARRAARARRRALELRLRAEAGAALLARQPDTVPALAAHLVDPERVRLLRELGAGRYGRVWLAELEPEEGRRGAGRRVAAKAPHAGAAPAEEGELLREAAALAPLRHAHVLRLEGVCVSAGGVLLLTPVARHGDLLRYLRARRPPGGEAGEARHVAAPALTRLAREAALALAYLASRGLVHCDVRAANCLVDERRSLRLADFGMARPLRVPCAGAGSGATEGEYACRRRALFPVLWMAPESLARGSFSCASDVWALGVLALELVTLGARPFGSLGAGEAVALVSRGGHARLPAGCSAETRELARACWRGSARARPTAREVAEWLEARPEALEPAPPRDAQDADSGFGEPASPGPDWELATPAADGAERPQMTDPQNHYH